MEVESQAVIDVEVQKIDFCQKESIERWYTAGQIQSILNLNKAALQKAITKLQNIYNIELESLRRGSARATEYSQLALKAIELLNSKKLSELRKLVDRVPAPVPVSEVTSGLTISEYTPELDNRIAQLSQAANSTSASLNQNVIQLLSRIAAENQSAQQRDADLDNAEINAAQNRGAARALAVFQAEQKAQSEVLAQLRAMKLGGAE
jgi:hypothetical protein